MTDTTRTFEISGSTEFAGVIGDPVAHSLSPRLHNRAYAELGVDIRYGAFRVPPGHAHAAMLGARELGFLGLSVTTPHKDDAARYADQRSDDVITLGAANTIVYLSGVAVAESTDGPGLLDDLEENLDFSVKGKSCALLGAGGAARAIVLALSRAGAEEIVIVNRSQARAAEAIAIAPEIARAGEIAEIGATSLVINATSLGLSAADGNSSARDQAAAFGEFLHHGQIALELTYLPARSVFLEVAAGRGAKVRNGLGMLVHQAAAQVRLFSGHKAPTRAMWDAVKEFSTS